MELRQQLIKDLDLLPDDILQAFSIIARKHITHKNESAPEAGKPVRPPFKYNSLAGKVWMADDFDSPIDDMKEYME